MATTLEQKLNLILNEKQTKILPENLKKGVNYFDIEGTLENSGIDTSDATATRDDILYPKTAYVKEQKITGNIQPHYAADSVTLYQNYDLGHAGNTYQSGVSIHLEDYIFSYYKLSNVYYIQAINANTHQIEVTQSYTATDLFNNNENDNVLLTYDNYNNTEYTLVLAKGRNNGNGDTRIWARRVKFTVSTKQFTLIDGIAVGTWGDEGNNFGFAAVGTQMLPNNFGVLYSHWRDNIGFAFAGITWTDTTGSIYNRANKSRIIPYNYGLEETGNGHIFSTPGAFIVINPTLTDYTYVNTSGYSYVSHDLRYMIYNRYLYRVTYNNNASTMFNSKVQIGTTQLPNYSWVRFSEDDSYIVLNSNGLNYIYTFDENGFISAQVINNVNQTLTGTDSDFQLINDTSTNLHLYKYDKGEVLTSVDIKGISYQHIEGQNVPANSNLVVNGIRYMGLNGVEVGSMPNNGQLTYTPTESTQSIPEGYTSGGTIEAWTSASEYQTCLDITEDILGQGDDV